MTFRRRKLTDRVQTLIDEMLHILRQESINASDSVPARAVQVTRLEERMLMSASPIALVAVAANDALEAAITESAGSESSAGAASEDQIFSGAIDQTVSSELSQPDFDGVLHPEDNPTSSETSPFEGVGSDPVTGMALVDSFNQTAKISESFESSAVIAGVELIVIDSRVEDADTLLSELLNTDRDFKILRLDLDTDGIAQITEKLEQIGNVSAIHLLTHGTDGEILLGSTVLNASTLSHHAPEFLAWQHNLTDNADLLLYGCDVAETIEGQDFIDALAQLTAADVAASSDITGAEALGGDWNLEYVTGSVEAATPFGSQIAQNWNETLAVVLVDTNEFAVNTTTANSQNTGAETRGSQQAVSLAADGSYVVVWSSLNQDGSGWGVYARRFDATGAALTGEIAVAQTSNGDQQWARVVSQDNGSFVVTWTGGATGSEDVYFQRFSANGTAVGSEVRANNTTTGVQKNSVIALDRTTNQFVIAWQGEGPGDTSSIFFRRFNSAGTAEDSTDQLVNTAGANAEQDPAIAMQTGGGFVIAYERGNSNKVYFQRFNGGGAKVGGETQIDNGLSTSFGISIASDAAGNFTVAYREQGIATGIWTRSFNADGTESHTWSRIATGDAVSSSISMASDGSYIVTWQESSDGDGFGVYAQRFNSDAGSNGDAFLVNQTTAGVQSQPSVAAFDVNSFVVVWSGQGPGDTEGVFARQYNLEIPSLDLDLDNSSGAFGNGYNASYVDGGGPVLVVDSDATLADVDSSDLQSLTVTITNRQNGNNEILAATTAGTNITASYANGILTLTGSDTVARYQQVLRTVSYNNLQNPATGASRNISFVASDGVNSSLVANTLVTMNPAVNQAPVITSNGGGAIASISVAENSTAVTTVVATDSNTPAQMLTYSISGGADASRFVINGSTGELSFVTAPNFELAMDTNANNVYDVIVTVSDGTLTDSQDIAVTVTNANETPTANAGGPYTIVAGSSLTLDGSGSTDPDSDPLTYRWDLDGDGIFGESGEPTTLTPTVSWSTLQSFGIHSGTNVIGLQVNDGNGGVNSTTVTLTVTGGAATLTPVADTHIERNSSENFGASTSVTVSKAGGSIGNERALLRFDLSSIPSNATITGATLKLNATSNSGVFDINVYELTQAWDEGVEDGNTDAASWNDRLDGVAWTDSGGTFDSTIVATLNTAATGIHSWDIRSLVQAWASGNKVNNGVILGSPDGGSETVIYDSKEGTTPPVLEITYTVPATAPTAVMVGGSLAIAEGGSLSLDGSNSSDPNFDPLTYEWDLNYNGTFSADATGVNPTLSWTALQAAGIDDNGSYQVALRAFDGTNYSTIVQQTLVVSNLAPTLSVTGAVTASAGNVYTLNLSSIDPGDDSISSWVINWGDGNIQTVTGNPASVTHVYTNVGFTNSIVVSATDEDGTHTPSDLYVTSFNTNQLFRYDGQTGAIVSTSVANLNPIDVQLGPDGLLYVTEFGTNDIDRYDPITGAFVDSFVDGRREELSDPARMAFGPDGNLYVANQGTGQILKFSGANGRFLGVFVELGSGGLTQPDGLTFGPDGNLYVGNYANGAILKYDGKTGASLGTFASFATSTYIDLNFGPNGNLFASSSALNVVREFNSVTGAVVGNLVTAGSSGMVAAGGFTWAPNGSLMVNDFGGSRVLNFSSSGAFLGEFVGTAAGMAQPIDLTYTPSLQVTVNAPPVAAGDSYTLNEGGTLNVAVASDWFNLNWRSRTQVTFDNAAATTNLTNVPVLVKLHATAADAVNVDYSKIQNFGEDLRFVDGNGNVLSHEIETWNESGYSYVWVKAPLISAGATAEAIWLYYDNPNAPDGAALHSVWESNDVAILHMNGTALDSSVNSNDGGQTDVAVTTGIVGEAGLFNGTTSSVNLGSDASVDDIFVNGGTISAWINPSGWGEGGYGRIADKATTTFGSGGNGNGWAFQVGGSGSSGYLLFEQGFTGTVGEWRTDSGTLNLNSWQHVVIVYDSSSPSNRPLFYINGVLQTTRTNTTPTGTASSDAAVNLTIGNFSQSAIRTFAGRIDEVRISNAATPGAEIAAQYRSVNGTFLTAGPPVSGPGGLQQNDSGPNDRPLSVTLVSGPAHATAFTLNPDGSFTYVHDDSETTSDSFVYQLSDGSFSSTATVNLAVQSVNDQIPSVTAGQSFSVSESASNNTVLGTINATDGDSDATLNGWAIVSGNDNGIFTINTTTGVVSILNNSLLDYESRDSHTLVVTVSDGVNTSPTQSITISVTPENDNAPIISSHAGNSSAAISVAENSSAVTTVTATDADLPGQALTYAITGVDASAFSINSSTGELSFVSPRDFESPTDADGDNVYEVTVEVSDGSLTDSQSLAVTVTNVNESPTMSINQTVSSLNDNVSTSSPIEIATITVADDSIGTNVLTLSGADASSFHLIGNRLALNAGTILNGALKTEYRVTVSVSDSSLGVNPISSQTVVLTIVYIDDPPTADAGGPYLISEGDSLTVSAGPSVDPDGLPLTYAWDIDGNGTFTDAAGATATLSWAELRSLANPVNDSGIRTVSLRVTDAGGNSTVASTTLTINNVAPTLLVTGNSTANSGVPYTIHLSATDPGQDTISTYTIQWGDGTTQTVPGTTTSVSHTYLAPGGTRSISVTATDEDGTFGMTGGPLVITVENTAPVLQGLASNVVANNTAGAIVGAILFNDPDLLDSHVYTVSDSRFTVVNGNLQLNSADSIDRATESTVPITITIADSTGASDTKSYVLAVNTLPVAAGEAFAVDGTREFNIANAALGILANDFDADGEVLQAVLVNGPTHSQNFALNADGTFLYRALSGYSGVDTFSYRISDGLSISNIVTATLTVNQPASLSFNRTVSSVDENTTLTNRLRIGQFAISDDGIGTNTIQLSGTNVSMFELDSTNNLYLRAGTILNFEALSTLSVTATVDDAAIAGSPDASRTVSLTVRDRNDRPTATALTSLVLQEDFGSRTINAGAAFQDEDGDPLTFSLNTVSQTSGLFQSLSINSSTGVISFSSALNRFGAATLEVRASDGRGGNVATTVSIDVLAVNDAPEVQPFSQSVLAGQILSGTGLLNGASDVEGSSLSAMLVRQAVHGVVTVRADGSYVYTPESGFYGIDTFQFAATDGAATSVARTATITVQPPVNGTGITTESGGGSSSVSTSVVETATTQTTSATSTTATTTATSSSSTPSNSATSSNSTAENASSNTGSTPMPLNLPATNSAVEEASSSDSDDDDLSMLAQFAASRNGTVASSLGLQQALATSVERDYSRRSSTDLSSPLFQQSKFERFNDFGGTSAIQRRELLYQSLIQQNIESADEFQEKRERKIGLSDRVVGSVEVVTTVSSVGYLIWNAVRGGMLLSSLMAQIPAWNMLDPLLVIDGDAKEDDKESLQNIMDQQQKKLKNQRDPVRPPEMATS